MPDIGFLELLLVGAIAFLILGPERMPELFAQVGRVVRKGRSLIADVRRQIDEETAPLKAPLHEVQETTSGIDDYNKAIMQELGESLQPDSGTKSEQDSATGRQGASANKQADQ